MAPLSPPSWQQAGTYPARLDRLTLAGLMAPHAGAGPLVARSGVKPSPSAASMQVTQRTTPDMWVTVGAGSCYIAATSIVGGSYECFNDAGYDVQIAASNPSLPRRDLVVARVYDAVDDTGSVNEFAIEVITGTAAASPARPATPSAAIALAEVLVPAASNSVVNANITDLRQWVTAVGGVLPVNGTSDLPVSPYKGMAIYRRDLSRAQVHDGSTWQDVFDGGMGFAFGTLAHEFDATTQNVTTTSETASGARIGGISGLTFTVPPGVPSGRQMFISFSAYVTRASGDAFFSFWVDGASLAQGRRMGIPSGVAYDLTTFRGFGVPATGTHSLDVRFWNESSGQTTTYWSANIAVLLL